LERIQPHCQRILLIPENHSRNSAYFANVHVLHQLLNEAGYQVRIGSMEHNDRYTVTSAEHPALTIEPITVVNHQAVVADFCPSVILLNRDFSEGIPTWCQHLTQPVVPPLTLSWQHRLKSEHFYYYHQVCQQLAPLLGIDPWLLEPLYRRCEEVNFMERGGEACLAHYSAELLTAIQRKYSEYGIAQQPFIMLKADAGTYGMGVMKIDQAKQVLQLNRKQRKKMAHLKGGRQVNKVILQEGVPTLETLGHPTHVAEPVIYTIGHRAIGGFYRVHAQKQANDNLNAPGMHFQPLPLPEGRSPFSSCSTQGDPATKRLYTYSVVTRLALLAAAREQQQKGVS
jgi:glutamate--cysteine ligase